MWFLILELCVRLSLFCCCCCSVASFSLPYQIPPQSTVTKQHISHNCWFSIDRSGSRAIGSCWRRCASARPTSCCLSRTFEYHLDVIYIWNIIWKDTNRRSSPRWSGCYGTGWCGNTASSKRRYFTPPPPPPYCLLGFIHSNKTQ